MSPALTYDYHLCRSRLSGRSPGNAALDVELPGETRQITLPGATVRINLTGSGARTVLLCPDPPHVLESYAPVIRAISSRFRVITFEAPGFGYSRPLRSYDFSVNQLAAIIGGVLDATDTKQVLSAVPCGHGYGALLFARNHPERVAGLVSIQTPEFGEYLNWVERVDPAGEIRQPLEGQRYVARNLQQIGRSWLRIAENDRELQAQYIETSAHHLHGGACYCLASALQKFAQTDNPFRDWRLDVPAAILWGASDKTYRRVPGNTFQEYLPQTSAENAASDNEISVIPKIGHFPEMTRPDLLLGLLQHVSSLA